MNESELGDIRNVLESKGKAEGNRASATSLPEASLLVCLLGNTGLSVGRELVGSGTLVDCACKPDGQ
jgi:hypothetical protein